MIYDDKKKIIKWYINLTISGNFDIQLNKLGGTVVYYVVLMHPLVKPKLGLLFT